MLGIRCRGSFFLSFPVTFADLSRFIYGTSYIHTYYL